MNNTSNVKKTLLYLKCTTLDYFPLTIKIKCVHDIETKEHILFIFNVSEISYIQLFRDFLYIENKYYKKYSRV